MKNITLKNDESITKKEYDKLRKIINGLSNRKSNENKNILREPICRKV